MRSKSKVRWAAMATLVAAALVMGAGQSSAEVRRIGVDFGPSIHSPNSPRNLKRPVRGAMSLAGSLRFILVRYLDVDGLGESFTLRMPVVRDPRQD